MHHACDVVFDNLSEAWLEAAARETVRLQRVRAEHEAHAGAVDHDAVDKTPQ